ncbi:MAG: rod shape-determining protein MreB [Mycoplasmataceae bacterium]|nr:rod shape-determining protein MreB [Mycoplasmataceae bacterium]
MTKLKKKNSKSMREIYNLQSKFTYISMDLGTANTLIYVEGQGIIFNERSIVAYSNTSGDVLAVGDAAFEMKGKTVRGVYLVEPLLNGVVGNIKSVSDMIRYAFMSVDSLHLLNDSIFVLASPSRITPLEAKGLEGVAKNLGAKYVYVEEEVKMSALGVGVDIHRPSGTLVVDIGGGTTDVAVVASGDIVVSKSIRIAGNYFTAEIQRLIKDLYNFDIGFRMAEEIKVKISSVTNSLIETDELLPIYGRDIHSGLPKSIYVKPQQIRIAFDEGVSRIINVIKLTIEEVAPELTVDLGKNGIFLAGGGALIKGLDKYISKVFGIPCYQGQDPLLSVINGTIAVKSRVKKVINIQEEYGVDTKRAEAILAKKAEKH